MSWVGKIAAWIGAVALFLGAGFHFTAQDFVRLEAAKLQDPFMKAALEPVWLMSSVHWIAFGLLSVAVTIKPSHHTRIVLLVIAAALITDAVLISNNLGAFAGAIILAFAGLCMLIAAVTVDLTTSQKMA